MTTLLYFIMAMATWRITHLVVDDQLPLIRAPREWLINRNPEGNLAYLVNCTACSSVWMAAGVVLATNIGMGVDMELPVLIAFGLSAFTLFAETIQEAIDIYIIHR